MYRTKKRREKTDKESEKGTLGRGEGSYGTDTNDQWVDFARIHLVMKDVIDFPYTAQMVCLRDLPTGLSGDGELLGGVDCDTVGVSQLGGAVWRWRDEREISWHIYLR
jgi:hypothetical protein